MSIKLHKQIEQVKQSDNSRMLRKVENVGIHLLSPIILLQQTVGNRAVQGLLQSNPIQAKLEIGQPNDEYEQEAERVAEQVMRMPEQGILSIYTKQRPTVMRTCDCSHLNEYPEQGLADTLQQRFPRLRIGNYCITEYPNSQYNCYGLTVNAVRPISEQSIVEDYGGSSYEGENSITYDDLNRFYRAYGYISQGYWENTTIVAYGTQNTPKHVARKTNIRCRDELLYDSKLGSDGPRATHFLSQLESGFYGRPRRGYIIGRLPERPSYPTRIPYSHPTRWSTALEPGEKIQKSSTTQSDSVNEDTVSQINAARGSGLPIPAGLRAFFESQYGYKFDKVRLHVDANADKLNANLSARAFTIGQDIFFRHSAFSPESFQGKKLLAHELVHVVQQGGETALNTLNNDVTDHAPFNKITQIHRSNNAQRLQRTLEEEINDLLDRTMPLPDTEANRITLIEALCNMPMLREDPRLPTRRRLLREVFELVEGIESVEEESESSRLYARLISRISSDSLSIAFFRLATATRNEMIGILERSRSRQNVVLEVASSPPSWRFSVPQSGDGILLNPEFWEVLFRARSGGIIIPSTNQNPRGLSAWQALQQDSRWTGTYEELILQVHIIGSPSDAVEDAWDEDSARNNYAVDCNIAANLVQLRAIYLYYHSQGQEQRRSTDTIRQAFDRDYQDFRLYYSGLPVPAQGVSPTLARTTLVEEGIGMTNLNPQRISILSGPDFGGRVIPGDWVAIDSTEIITGVYSYENAIYLGNNRFYGHPLGTFTPEQYAAEINRCCRGDRRPRVEWPPEFIDLLANIYIRPTGRPRSPRVQF